MARRGQAERSWPPGEILAGIPEARPDLLRRPGGASGLLPRRIRRAAQMARRGGLRRSARALSQFLPGAASSKFGMAVGLLRAGMIGGLAAWIGFTLPSALLMIGFGYGIARFGGLAGAAWLHGLMLVALAVVALAVWQMARRLANDVPRGALALAAAGIALALPASWSQLAAIAFGGDDRPAVPDRPGAARGATLPSAHPARRLGRGDGAVLPAARAAAGARGGVRIRTRSSCWTVSTAPARWCSAAATCCCRCLHAVVVPKGWV